jgi:type IV pilus assembly protein PilA
MRLLENFKQKKANNKGFSLVELIIVMAIMAILVGVVGTQVIPYLNRARESKDLQILNSFSTAAVSAYSLHAEDVVGATDIKISYKGASATVTPSTATSVDADKIIDEIKTLTGYDDVATAQAAMSSNASKDIDDIIIDIDISGQKVTVTAVKSDGSTQVLDKVESTL